MPRTGTGEFCGECGKELTQEEIDNKNGEGSCFECIDGFWEEMGEDPHGKNWE